MPRSFGCLSGAHSKTGKYHARLTRNRGKLHTELHSADAIMQITWKQINGVVDNRPNNSTCFRKIPNNLAQNSRGSCQENEVSPQRTQGSPPVSPCAPRLDVLLRHPARTAPPAIVARPRARASGVVPYTPAPLRPGRNDWAGVGVESQAGGGGFVIRFMDLASKLPLHAPP